MKCDKCKNKMAHSWDGSSWCPHCEPVDTDVKTCECGGRVDQFCYLEEDDEGCTPKKGHSLSYLHKKRERMGETNFIVDGEVKFIVERIEDIIEDEEQS